MKKIIIVLVGVYIELISWGIGVPKQYIELKSGLEVAQEECGVHYKKAPCFSAEYGRSWDRWRFGFQLGYIQHYINRIEAHSFYHARAFDPAYVANARFTAISVMANLYRDWQICEKVACYVGCGLGCVRLNYHFLDNQMCLTDDPTQCFDQDKYLFAAQIMCGVAYSLNDRWVLSLGYRCMGMESVKYNDVVEEDVFPTLETPLLHSLEVGLRYSF